MGAGSFTPHDWDRFREVNRVQDTSADTLFRNKIKLEFDPKNMRVRESCENQNKQEVTPIIIALDVTGSMGKIPEILIKGALGDLMRQILANRSIPNPHIMFMAIGDVNYDTAPLQVTQFEADIRIASQLKDLYLEGGGGPNDSESYPLAWYFAATRTKLDSYKNRQEKGILFTIGDEYAPQSIKGSHLRQVFGDEQAQDTSTTDILARVKETYDVFHLGIKQSRSFTPSVQKQWTELLGQRLIPVADYTKIDSVIVSTIDMLLAERRQAKQRMNQHFSSRVGALSGQVSGVHSAPTQAAFADAPPSYDDAMSASPMRF